MDCSHGVRSYLILVVDVCHTLLRDSEIAVRLDFMGEHGVVGLLVRHGFTKMGLPCFEPKGAFYIFPDITSTGYTSDEFAEELLKAEHVALIPGSAFGACGEGHVRCSYATSIDKISEALARIENFLKNHQR